MIMAGILILLFWSLNKKVLATVLFHANFTQGKECNFYQWNLLTVKLRNFNSSCVFFKDYSLLLLIPYSKQFYYGWNFINCSSTP